MDSWAQLCNEAPCWSNNTHHCILMDSRFHKFQDSLFPVGNELTWSWNEGNWLLCSHAPRNGLETCFLPKPGQHVAELQAAPAGSGPGISGHLSRAASKGLNAAPHLEPVPPSWALESLFSLSLLTGYSVPHQAPWPPCWVWLQLRGWRFCFLKTPSWGTERLHSICLSCS